LARTTLTMQLHSMLLCKCDHASSVIMRSAHLSLNTEAMSFMQNAMRCEWNYYEFLINCRCPGKTLTTLARDTSGKSGKRQATTTRLVILMPRSG